MRNLMNKIKEECDTVVDMFEIEYIPDYPDTIDVRLYGEGYNNAKIVEDNINNHLKKDINSTELYMPHPDSVKFGFSGYQFVGITVSANIEDLCLEDEEVLVVENNRFEKDI